MKKYYIFGILLLLVIGAAVVYYFGFYTYFLRTEVQEQEPVASGQRALATGTFEKIDIIHQGSGTAKLIEADGKTILRFEDFSVTSGPDLYVYLSKSETPTGDVESLGDYLDLGLLKGTMGNQNYELPAGSGDYKTAVIWCKRFGVLFSYAVMK